MNPTPTNETTPGELLTNFNGRSLKTMIVFTIVVHAALLLVTSGPFIWKAVTGTDTSKLSEGERIELAFKETQSAMRRIAEQHGIKPQELGSRFTAPTAAPKSAPPKTDSKVDSKADAKAEPKTAPANSQPPAPEEPKSAIEKELKTAKPGPTVPADEDLIFK